MRDDDGGAPATDHVEPARSGWTGPDLPIGEPTPKALLGLDEHGRAELIDLTPDLEQEAEKAHPPGHTRLVESSPRQVREGEA
jgi:hypothetical protein